MDLNELWQAVLGELEVEQSRASFKTWFKATQLVSVNEGVATVSVQSSFTKEWLEQKFHKQLKSILARHIENLKDLQYHIGTFKPPAAQELDTFTPTHPDKEVSAKTFIGQNRLRKEYTFDSFVVGSSNRLAYATAKAVSEKPGATHNPLFIYGGVGLGKTHLMHAIGNLIGDLHPNFSILYVSCEDFANEFIQAIQRKQMEPFKKKYRSVDLFLIDDIQFLSRKEGTQEEFFHTFNTLHQRRAQIIMTSDRLPRSIPDLEERLSSRFGGGMVADVSPPNFETRVAILQAKCRDRNIDIPEPILSYIANRVKTNIRDLEGALNRLVAHWELQQFELTEQGAASVLESIFQLGNQAVNPQYVIDTICSYFSIRTEDLMSSKRSRDLVYPRQITMYLLRSELSLSYPTIGKILGGKDHTTIIHGFDTINGQLSTNIQLKNDVNLLKEKITAVG